MQARKEDWKEFQSLTGDTNPLHFDREYARNSKFQLEDIIAPGMYVASAIENEPWFNELEGLKLRFTKEVRDGDEIEISKDGEYIFWKNQNNEVVIKGNITMREDIETKCTSSCYERIIDKEDIEKFCEIMEIKKEGIPRMYIASLIPTTLLIYCNQIGMYRKQRLNFHKSAEIGDKISVYINKLSAKGNIETYLTLCKNQKDEVIVDGEATCVSM